MDEKEKNINIEEEVIEESVETSNNNEEAEKSSFNPNEYKLILDMIKEMESQYEMLKQFTESTIRSNYNLNPSIIYALVGYLKEDIENMSLEECKNLLTKYGSEENTENIIKACNDENQDELNVVKSIIKEIKEGQLTLMNAKFEADQIKAESEEIVQDYMNYLSSPKVQEYRLKKLSLMKEAAEKEEDPVKKREMIEMINAIESTQTYSFIYSRFKEYGPKELANITEKFFNDSQGSYIINKFRTKISKFGFNENLYKYFFNIEENFLDEKYHPYNNLFLFIVMRFIAYADPYNKIDKMQVQAIYSAMANLIYHRFEREEKEAEFIKFIESILNLFIDAGYTEKYFEENITNPNHEARITADKKREADRKIALINKMDELNISGYDVNATADELQKYMNDKLDELIELQRTKEEKQEETEVEEIPVESLPQLSENTDNEDEGIITYIDTVSEIEE